MSRHLYNTIVFKVPWFARRFGWRELILKPLRCLLAPIIIPCLPRRRFHFQGQDLELFYHPYNMTWAGERCVEIPIARVFIENAAGRALEIGNVLSHYLPVTHQIVDKYEKAPGVVNEDIVEFHTDLRYDVIISVSTFEHIGFDDDTPTSSGDKIAKAISSSRALLGKNGRLILTCPIGYNPELDKMLSTGALQPLKETYLKKCGRLDWRQVSKSEGLNCMFGNPYPYANAIVVAEFGPI